MSGIIQTALLTYASNRAAKKMEEKEDNANDKAKRIEYRNTRNGFYKMKRDALVTLLSEIYVLANTSEEYKDYFSYGRRFDEEGDYTFVIDVPYVGQVSIHLGNDQNRVWKKAIDNTKKILKRKLELGQISEEEFEQINEKLEANGFEEICPKYGGELVEFNNALPIEFIGDEVKRIRKEIGMIEQNGRRVFKSPEDFTVEDIAKAKKIGLNYREIYYFFLKMGAPKKILEEIARYIRGEGSQGQDGNGGKDDDWDR